MAKSIINAAIFYSSREKFTSYILLKMNEYAM